MMTIMRRKTEKRVGENDDENKKEKGEEDGGE